MAPVGIRQKPPRPGRTPKRLSDVCAGPCISDNAAVLTCAAYIDLNPIRAGIAETPEESDYTSAQDRILARQAEQNLVQLPESAKTNPEGKNVATIARKMGMDRKTVHCNGACYPTPFQGEFIWV